MDHIIRNTVAYISQKLKEGSSGAFQKKWLFWACLILMKYIYFRFWNIMAYSVILYIVRCKQTNNDLSHILKDSQKCISISAFNALKTSKTIKINPMLTWQPF